MARHFVGSTSEYLRTFKLGVLTYPFTIAAWFYMTTLSGTNRLIFGMFRTDSANDQFVIRVNFATSQLQFRADAGGASNATVSGMAAGQWYHVVARGFSATDRRVRVNNGTDATDTVSKSPAGLGQILFGPSWDAGTFATSPTMVGREQEAAIWNATLDDQEIAALYGGGIGLGLSPARIRPGNLAHYWPLEGRHDVELDYGLARSHLQVAGTQPFPHMPVKLARANQRVLDVLSGAASYTMAGAGSGQGSATASMLKSAPMAAANSGQGTATADMRKNTPMAASNAGAGTQTGAMGVSKPMAAANAGAGSQTGAMTVGKTMAGAGSGQGSQTGAMNKSAAMAATGAGVGSQSGAMLVSKPMAATGSGVGSQSGDMAGGHVSADAGDDRIVRQRRNRFGRR